ncbi:hypothetical protein [Methanosarcina mazei]|jgi:hypothetical protein|nr:hypothetical protein [Methanosarcina mazei]WIM42272.1 hypothetical protein PSF70_12170 [Methanosarcina mazei]WIM45597.1 hypothetical protein PQQ20_11390 [Methanosarcina mazei]
MGIKMYELASVRMKVGQIILNLFILFLVVAFGLVVVEVVLKCLIIEGFF